MIARPVAHSQTEAATPLARALWLINKLEGDPNSGKCCCPAHDDEDPSLDISLTEFTKTGQPLFICRAHCSQDAVISALKARGLWPIPGTVPITNTGEIKRHRSPEERLAYARDIYNGVKRQRWDRTLASEYFHTRGINDVPVEALLTMPLPRGDVRDPQMLSVDPGIVFRVRDRDNKFKGAHVIWLNPDLNWKREAEPRQQSFGPIKGGYVQLGDLDPGQPVLIAEGPETALAALQATGLPCACVGCGKNTSDIDIPAHSHAIIAADNGASGQATATKLARRLHGANCSVRIATPIRPEGGKDGYDWNDALMDGGDPVTLRDAILNAPIFDPEQADGADEEERVVLPSGAPLVAAKEYIKRRESSGEIPLLRTYRGAFYRWTGTHWREYPDEKVAATLYDLLNEALAVSKRDIGPYNPTRGKVDNVIHALRHVVLVNQDRETPCWLDRRKGQPPRDLVACRNGILNLKTRELLPHDPQFFTMNCMPLEYDPDAPQPRGWLKFLEDLWPTTDPARKAANEMAKQCLMEIIGYLLTPDTSQQKIFLIVGPKRGGKGTIVWVLRQLLGSENIVAPTLKSMTGEFGRWPLIDKNLAVITDARLGPNTDAHAVAEQLLSISGGDPQSINRKNQSFWNGLLGVRFLITTNELPAIADSSGTLSSRFVLLRLTLSFYGKEDLLLKRKLKPELAGILNMALDGLDRLRARGHFEMPPTSLDSIRQLEDLGSPVAAFLRDWGENGANETVNVKLFYAAYRVWCEEVGQKPLPRHVFGRGLHAVVPTVTTAGRGARRAYVGVALSADGLEQYEAAQEVTRRAARRG